MDKLINHLFNYHKVQLAVFPEFIAFLKGRKKIIRIVIDDSNNLFDFKLFQTFGFIVKETILYCSHEQNSFGNLVAHINEIDRDKFNVVKMYSISKAKKDLDDFEYAELYGDILKAGKYLGYPDCCVNNVENINKLNSKWATFYLEDFQKNKIANHFTNRFPITWGGISVIGELFPCSLMCSHAIEYSKKMYSDVIEFGFNQISDAMIIHSLKPVFINKMNGAILTVENENYEIINFS